MVLDHAEWFEYPKVAAGVRNKARSRSIDFCPSDSAIGEKENLLRAERCYEERRERDLGLPECPTTREPRVVFSNPPTSCSCTNEPGGSPVDSISPPLREWLPSLRSCLRPAMSMVRAILLGLALASLECAGGDTQEHVSFSKDVQPILRENCVLCHSAEVHTGGVALDSFEHLMSSRYLNRPTPFVIPGDPNRSRLVIVVHTSNTELRMPPAASGLQPIGQESIRVIRRWIEEGARNN